MLRPRDLASEVAASVGARRARALFTSLGIALGVAALLGSVAMARSASVSIQGRLEQVAVTTATLRITVATEEDQLGVLSRAERNLRSMRDVLSVGASADLSDTVEPPVARPAVQERRRSTSGGVLAVSKQFLEAVGLPAPAHPARGAVVGTLASERLATDGGYVFVGGRALTIDRVAPRGSIDGRVDGAVLVPLSSAATFGWLAFVDEFVVVVRTAPGRAAAVADQAAVAAWPEHPELVEVSVAPDPRRLREGIERDTLLLVSALASLLVVVGVFSIANAMLTSVMERRGEIGLRRALGASRADIALLVVIESCVLGAFGGVAGAATGTAASVAAALLRDWPVQVDPWHLLAAPLGGAVVGGLAGLHPARRASRLDPAVALRS